MEEKEDKMKIEGWNLEKTACSLSESLILYCLSVYYLQLSVNWLS